MKVVMCEPYKKAYVTEIGSELSDLQAAVGGGFIEAVYPFDDNVGLICNDEGKFNGMEPCRALYDDDGKIYDVVYGPCFIVGLGEEDFTDLSDELAEKYVKKMSKPVLGLMKMGDHIMVL